MKMFPGDDNRKFRDNILKFIVPLNFRIMLFIGGIVWINTEYMYEADYRKWLGPEWKPQWTGASTIVPNHVCWVDIIFLLGQFMPSFVSKRAI